MSIGLEFLINMYSISGLKVDSLRIFHEAYKPYKVTVNGVLEKQTS
jgi:AP-3 complex subunit mu